MDPRPLYVTCPHTGWPVHTGLALDPAAFQSAKVGQRVLQCPRCGRTHPWQKDDAYFIDDDEALRQSS